MEVKRHKNTRIKNYDYSTTGHYFVTICTSNRKNVLCTIVEAFPQVEQFQYKTILTDIGKVVDKYINNIRKVYSNITLDCYVIMPNHIHLIVVMGNKSTLALSQIIRSLKIIISKEIGGVIWQENYYEHIIRCEQDLYETRKYIENNPSKWCEDKYYIKE
jgi:REP element-mobilizing transposase RayT